MIYLVTNQTSLFESTYERVSVSESLAYLKELKHIGLDTETQGLDAYTKALLSLQLGDFENQYVIDASTVDVREYKSLLESDRIFLGHNMKFDLQFMFKKGIFLRNVICTYMQEKVIHHGIQDKLFRFGLADCAERYLGIQLDKSVRRLIHIEGLSDKVIKYGADDVKYLIPIHQAQRELLVEKGVERAADLENRFVNALAYTEHCGIKLDEVKWKQKCAKDLKHLKDVEIKLNNFLLADSHKYYKWIDSQLDLFNTDLKTKINWSSSKQVIELFNYLGIEIEIEDTNSDDRNAMKDSVNGKLLEMHKNDHPILPLYLDFKKAEKVVTTYGENWLKNIHPVTNRLHTSFNQLLNTGRLSSGAKSKRGELRKFNFQNIPADEFTRSCFVSEEGNVLVGCDYSGQENILLANVTLDPSLLAFYDAGETDMHSFICREIAKISDVFPKEIATMSLNDIKKYHSESRKKTKNAVFAINYGGNGFTIARTLGISEAEGNEIYEAYFTAFPGLKAYFTSVQNNACENGYILFNNTSNRKYFLPNFHRYKQLEIRIDSKQQWTRYKQMDRNSVEYGIRKGEVREYFKMKSEIGRLAMNYPIQGTAADMTKIAVIHLYEWILKRNLQDVVKIVNQVHDEVLVECPESISLQVAEAVEFFMQKASRPFCKRIPMKAVAEITKFWKK